MIDDKLVYKSGTCLDEYQNIGINFLFFFAGQLIELYLLCMFNRKYQLNSFTMLLIG